MKCLGKVTQYLGLEITQNDKGCYELCQSSKIDKLLEQFGLSEAHEVATPMSTGCVREPKDQVFTNTSLYQSLVGSLLYLACWSRPDIFFAVHWLCQQCANPCQKDWIAAKRVLKYLKATKHHKLVLDTTQGSGVYAYSDSSWADELQTGKSTTGYAIFCYGALILWKSQKQSIVATSSAEAEFAALCTCVLDLEWISQLFTDLHIKHDKPISVFCDNTAVAHIAHDQALKGRSKHIVIRYQTVRESVHRGFIAVKHCPSHANISDGFTKAICIDAFVKFRSLLGVLPQSTEEECQIPVACASV